MYCDAKKRQSEYNGRPIAGVDYEKKKNKPLIPPVPFSLTPSKNALHEERDATDKHDRRQQVIESFNAKLKAKVDRKMERDKKKYLIDLKK